VAADDSNNITGEANTQNQGGQVRPTRRKRKEGKVCTNLNIRTGEHEWPTERGEEDRRRTTQNHNSWTGVDKAPQTGEMDSANT
jgi:hypothetical protein